MTSEISGAGRRGSGSGGLASFEKELICSICTEVLYQPLTILNCLHTFCGSCLKEWFSHQHRKASSSRSSASSHANPYTCPTCRAEVKDVQHNATVSNLLELFLAANPARNRSQEEKNEMDQIYKPDGTRPRDKILPKVERRSERRSRRESEGIVRERQMIEEARQRSLQDSLAPPNQRSPRSVSREREDRRHRRRERERQREQSSTLTIPDSAQPGDSDQSDHLSTSPPATSPRHPNAIEARQREQRMSHQASLRSLVSASENGAGTGDSMDEARIMQEILEEGLLGDIDVDTLSESEQDALAERIAELYRQRHPRGSLPSSPPQNSTASQSASHELRTRSTHSRDQQAGSLESLMERPTMPTANSLPQPVIRSEVPAQSMPPTSIIRSNSHGQSVTIHHKRRTSGQARSHHTPTGSRASSTERRTHSTGQQTSNSETSLIRSLSNGAFRARSGDTHSPRASETWPRRDSDKVEASFLPGLSSAKTMPVTASKSANDVSQIAELDGASVVAPNSHTQQHFDEPLTTCFRCNRSDLQYDVHKHCRSCDLNLCMQCYRAGKGCKHWFGFGHVAEASFESLKLRDESTEEPHVLIGRQYQRPPPLSVNSTRTSTRTQRQQPARSTSNPADRLQEGHFCNRCGSFANSQFWLCDICNDGEWGFCKSCVQSHHCCTHPLLPVAYYPQPLTDAMNQLNITKSSSLQPTLSNAINSRPHTPNSVRSARSQPGFGYDYLFIDVTCDMCRQPIITPAPYYHCPFHETDFDICTPCYQSYLSRPRMRRDTNTSTEVTAGWRKCPSGHRMIILAFEADISDDGDGGMRRVLKQDLVGGWKMNEADIRAWNAEHANSYNTPPTSPPLSNRGTWTWKEDTTGTRKTRSRSATLDKNRQNEASTMRFPRGGGFGTKGVAYYAYWPEEGEDGAGELALPRAAEVNEIEDVNGDWWSGVYAGDIGVFPYGFVREYK